MQDQLPGDFDRYLRQQLRQRSVSTTEGLRFLDTWPAGAVIPILCRWLYESHRRRRLAGAALVINALLTLPILITGCVSNNFATFLFTLALLTGLWVSVAYLSRRGRWAWYAERALADRLGQVTTDQVPDLLDAAMAVFAEAGQEPTLRNALTGTLLRLLPQVAEPEKLSARHRDFLARTARRNAFYRPEVTAAMLLVLGEARDTCLVRDARFWMKEGDVRRAEAAAEYLRLCGEIQ